MARIDRAVVACIVKGDCRDGRRIRKVVEEYGVFTSRSVSRYGDLEIFEREGAIDAGRRWCVA